VEAIKQAMRNKFDYKGREVQTIYPDIKERGAATKPPIADNLRGEITQWEIWDCYIDEFKREEK
jgi:dynein intermediate chain 1